MKSTKKLVLLSALVAFSIQPAFAEEGRKPAKKDVATSLKDKLPSLNFKGLYDTAKFVGPLAVLYAFHKHDVSHVTDNLNVPFVDNRDAWKAAMQDVWKAVLAVIAVDLVKDKVRPMLQWTDDLGNNVAESLDNTLVS